MENLEFIAVLSVGFIVAGWYLFNAEKKASGELGLLALKPAAVISPEKRRSRYRIKDRSAVRARDRRTIDATKANAAPTPAYRERDDAAQARRRFRRQDEARYRVKDKLTDEFASRDRNE